MFTFCRSQIMIRCTSKIKWLKVAFSKLFILPPSSDFWGIIFHGWRNMPANLTQGAGCQQQWIMFTCLRLLGEKKIGQDIFPFLIRVCPVYRCKFKLIIIVWVLFVVVGDDKLLCIACLDADHSNALWARRNEIYNTDNLLRPHFNFEQSKLFFRSSSCNFLLLKRTHVEITIEQCM